MKKIFSILALLLVIFFLFHALRDFMQLIGLHNFFTEFGHTQGIGVSDKILGIVGLKYAKWTEIPMILLELILVKILYKYWKK